MPDPLPSLSTDQVAAFVELARQGSLRAAARELHVTEQGLRNRLLALEAKLGVELYRKSRGLRRSTQLTEPGARFLPRASAFLEHARDLCGLFSSGVGRRDIHVVASHYLTLYFLIDAVRRFHREFPSINVRLSTLNEQEVEAALLQDPDVCLGVAAPYESSTELEYAELLAQDWSLIAPRRHSLLRRTRLRLRDLAAEPLILFEPGSSGRQHVIDAFHARDLTPRVAMETTNTEIIVRMVEAGLGLSIVPLLPSGVVTRGRRVGTRSLGRRIRPIHSGVLWRRGETLPEAARVFREFVLSL